MSSLLMQSSNHALPGFLGELALGRTLDLFVETRSGLMKKLQVFLITLAPDTDEAVQPHPASSLERGRLIEAARGEAGHLRAIGRVVPHPDHPFHFQ